MNLNKIEQARQRRYFLHVINAQHKLIEALELNAIPSKEEVNLPALLQQLEALHRQQEAQNAAQMRLVKLIVQSVYKAKPSNFPHSVGSSSLLTSDRRSQRRSANRYNAI